MKRSLILTFVFALASFTGAFAQKISGSPKAQPAKQESKAEKPVPANSQTPAADPSGGKRAEKGNNGKHKGHSKGHKKGQSNAKHGNAKKGEGNNQKVEGKGRKNRTKGNTPTPSTTPAGSPKNDKTQN